MIYFIIYLIGFILVWIGDKLLTAKCDNDWNAVLMRLAFSIASWFTIIAALIYNLAPPKPPKWL
jgi:predicted tellurium resistance membrane protein TerC